LRIAVPLSVEMDSVSGVARQEVVHGTYPEVILPWKRKWRNNGSKQRFRNRSNNKQQQGAKVFVLQSGVYDPPRLKDLQRQNRLKTRRHFPRRRKSVPRAPFNDSSFLMRVRRSGGLASLVSPAAATTPAFFSTPVFSPAPHHYREGLLVEEVKDLGVNGYGSMAGLIHLRAFDDEPRSMSTGSVANESSTRNDGTATQQPAPSSSPQSSVQQLEQSLEQRLDRDVSRFEMTYPLTYGMNNASQLMEVRLAEQESHIAYLEDENLTLRERFFLMQQELIELQQRVQGGGVSSVIHEHEDACSDYGSSD
jgi:hypothetical protein